MSLSKQKFSSYINDFNFRELFNEMGWNNDKSVVPITIIDVGTQHVVSLHGIASKSGFKILSLPFDKKIPSKDIRKKIQRTVSKYFYEHLIIYYDTKKSHQIWQTAIRLPNKPIKIHEVEWSLSQDPEILYQRTSGLFFTFEEEEILTIVDVLKKIQDNFNTNSEKVTKKFYERFKKEHGAFYSFIEGIEKESDQRWYASLMLNRLMFIYFIQKKGFLDGDNNYLKNKLNNIKELRGDNKFYKSFYKLFLCRLFHEGLGKPHETDKELIGLIGKVPYLNGGLFDVHELEKDNDKLDVKDEAFVRLFDFFDEYNWHLDDRITASGKDINPDVIGYIFEKYINDRASMGAYYTKEDITEYISKNCIIPFLFDKAKENCTNAFLPSSSLWQMLKQDPDRYIYDAVKHGINFDSGIREGLPDDVLAGLDAPDSELVEKRKAWNKPAPAGIALPTEIYREVIERRKRYFDIRQKIESGKIFEINDFITYNLNIRQFAQDAIDNYEGSDFIESFYAAIAGRKYDDKNSGKELTMGITILDPTCGSGAFLFAALNVLEPLYEGCIKRMREFIEADNSHTVKKFKQFRIVLKEIENHPSESYYILKSIILNNLYGVDIMKEAVETAKLRLFLKLVAQTEDFEHIEPLPDIDFNIRCGNTLVGFATEAELQKGLTWTLDGPTARPAIEESCEIVAKAFSRYKQIQLTQNDDYEEFCAAKKELNKRLNVLNERLNRLLKLQTSDLKYDEWLNTYQPFHWFAEFYEIVNDRGGFNVIIGNPPYVEYTTKKFSYVLDELVFKTFPTRNLYSFVFERSKQLLHSRSRISMIVQISSISTPNMEEMVEEINRNSSNNWLSNFATRPAYLFDGVTMNLTIIICEILKADTLLQPNIFTSHYLRWNPEYRDKLFRYIPYNKVDNNKLLFKYAIPKLSTSKENELLSKLFAQKKVISQYLEPKKKSKEELFYRTAGGRYFKIFFDRNFESESKSNKSKFFRNEYNVYVFISVLSSNFWWWYYTLHFDMYNCKDYMMFSFLFDYSKYKNISRLKNLGIQLCNDMNVNAERKLQSYLTTGERMQLIFRPSLSKSIIDEIDTVLADHYGFTAEELDFIINYDIKYRMGKELDNGEEEE
ncbi:MAG: Eco57I restriction-modification methylase domain-containing protein [Bacteroidales bacterium]|nr:Eco57I restriction-modification methylase domain-containing protein [Bacteroidales bacterium]